MHIPWLFRGWHSYRGMVRGRVHELYCVDDARTKTPLFLAAAVCRLSELAIPYDIFKSNGFDVVIASVRGGPGMFVIPKPPYMAPEHIPWIHSFQLDLLKQGSGSTRTWKLLLYSVLPNETHQCFLHAPKKILTPTISKFHTVPLDPKSQKLAENDSAGSETHRFLTNGEFDKWKKCTAKFANMSIFSLVATQLLSSSVPLQKIDKVRVKAPELA